MDRPKLEVADVFRRYGEAYRQEHGASLSTAQRRAMTAIEVCREWHEVKAHLGFIFWPVSVWCGMHFFARFGK